MLPHGKPGKPRVDDRRVISGILHVLKTGCRWRDVPSAYGPPMTIYNRFYRWARRGLWRRVFEQIPDQAHLDVMNPIAPRLATAAHHRP